MVLILETGSVLLESALICIGLHGLLHSDDVGFRPMTLEPTVFHLLDLPTSKADHFREANVSLSFQQVLELLCHQN